MNTLLIIVQRFKVAACMVLCTLCPLVSALGQTVAIENDPIVNALKEIERADWDHRWTGYNIALVGSAVGMGMGVWGLYQSPLADADNPDPVVFAASIVLVGTATSQVVHGGMRFDERVLGATDARRLLNDEQARDSSALFFLTNRAEAARSTRLWGGLMTTAQGIATTALGGRLWHKGSGRLEITGMVFTGMGIVNTAIGAIHFPGKPRSGRVLDKTLRALNKRPSVVLRPSALPSQDGEWTPGMIAGGVF